MQSAELDRPMNSMLDIVPFPNRFVPNTVMLMSEKRVHLEEDSSKTCRHTPVCTQFDAGTIVELQISPDVVSMYTMV